MDGKVVAKPFTHCACGRGLNELVKSEDGSKAACPCGKVYGFGKMVLEYETIEDPKDA